MYKFYTKYSVKFQYKSRGVIPKFNNLELQSQSFTYTRCFQNVSKVSSQIRI